MLAALNVLVKGWQGPAVFDESTELGSSALPAAACWTPVKSGPSRPGTTQPPPPTLSHMQVV